MGGGGGGRRSLGDIRALEQRAKEALQGGKRNVFISFAMEDLDEVNLLRAHAKNEKSDIEFNDYSVREPYDSERAEYIRQKITERIERASVTVVYLSESTPQSKWVKWEVEKSLSLESVLSRCTLLTSRRRSCLRGSPKRKSVSCHGRSWRMN